MFRSTDELVAQVRYYLSHPAARDRVARAGHRRTAEQHIYPARFAEIFNRLPPTLERGKSALNDLAEAEARHRIGLASRSLARIDCARVPPSIRGWQARGLRAARRLAYELSWRFVGERTYRAAGWPGRLFFRES